MSNDQNERLIDLLEKALMIQLHLMAKMLNKSKTDVNNFLKPIAKGKR
jgi:hypothetical protein